VLASYGPDRNANFDVLTPGTDAAKRQRRPTCA